MVGHVERAAAAVELILHPLVVLGLLEEGQHLSIAPALVAQLGPVVIVRGMATDVDHVVDRAGPAERPPARPRESPHVAVELRHGPVAPVEGAVGQEAHQGGGVDERRAVRAACLEQEHPNGRIGGEAMGKHAAGGAGAHDDVVVHDEPPRVTEGCLAQCAALGVGAQHPVVDIGAVVARRPRDARSRRRSPRDVPDISADAERNGGRLPARIGRACLTRPEGRASMPSTTEDPHA